jgi:hypothetical protein
MEGHFEHDKIRKEILNMTHVKMNFEHNTYEGVIQTRHFMKGNYNHDTYGTSTTLYNCRTLMDSKEYHFDHQLVERN